MQFILDHLAALIISTTVLTIVAIIQIRSTNTMIETHVVEGVFTDMQSLHEMLEWELSMMATEDYIDTKAKPEGRFWGHTGNFHCELSQDTVKGNTTEFIFPTFEIPFGIADSLRPPPDSVDVIEVKYTLVPLTDSLAVWSNTDFENVGLFRLERSVNDTLTGSLNEVLANFRVEQIALNGGPDGFIASSGMCPTDMKKIRYQYQVINQGIDLVTDDQVNTNRLNQGQFGMTIDLARW